MSITDLIDLQSLVQKPMSIKVSGQDGPPPKNCLLLVPLAQDIVSREVEV